MGPGFFSEKSKNLVVLQNALFQLQPDIIGMRGNWSHSRRLTLAGPFAWILSCLCCSCVPMLADDFRDAGFLYDQFDLTLATWHRTEALGPLFYSEEKE